MMHEGYQGWVQDPQNTYQHHVLTSAVQQKKRVADFYKARIGVTPNEEVLSTLNEAIEFAVIIADNYEKRWGSPLPEDFTMLMPEQKVVIPVEATRHECPDCEGSKKEFAWSESATRWLPVGDCPTCNGTGEEVHALELRFDGLIQRDDGLLYVLEHKTYGSRPAESSLRFNDQFLAYLWAAKQLNMGDVGGISYDGMWRRKAVPKGKTFEDLFMRLLLDRTKQELVEFEQFLPLELMQMAALYRMPDTAYPNRAWNGCWDCKVAPICDAMSTGGDVDAVIRNGFTERDDDVEAEIVEAA